jgi:hypothetical protein
MFKPFRSYPSRYGLGALSANETMPCHQPKTCVEPNVGHSISCTSNWPFARYHEPTFGGTGYIQHIWLLCLPRFENGRTMSMNMEWKELHQWGGIVGTPRTPKKGCVGIYYSYVEYMEGSHPMYVDAWKALIPSAQSDLVF